jgi:hypothetical protein
VRFFRKKCSIGLDLEISLALEREEPALQALLSFRIQSERDCDAMIYMNIAKVSELVRQSGKSDTQFCAHAKISKQVLFRLLKHGGPVMVPTAEKIGAALGVTPSSLLDRQRTSTHDALRV